MVYDMEKEPILHKTVTMKENFKTILDMDTEYKHILLIQMILMRKFTMKVNGEMIANTLGYLNLKMV